MQAPLQVTSDDAATGVGTSEVVAGGVVEEVDVDEPEEPPPQANRQLQTAIAASNFIFDLNMHPPTNSLIIPNIITTYGIGRGVKLLSGA